MTRIPLIIASALIGYLIATVTSQCPDCERLGRLAEVTRGVAIDFARQGIDSGDIDFEIGRRAR